jgi:aminoglycoside phosphotransferase (APT) family kinase protein
MSIQARFAPAMFNEGRLSAYLAGRLAGFAPPMRLIPFGGGRSNPTFLVETPTWSFVLRKKPDGPLLPSAHAIGREVRVLAALELSGIPVPGVLLHCEDQGVIGTEFYLMEWIPGRTFSGPRLEGLMPRERAALYDDFIELLSRLHALDPSKLGLADFGKPQGYIERQIRRWSEQYRATQTADIPEMDELISWLTLNIPDDDMTSIVHGDYTMRNCIVHPRAPIIASIIDWELSTLGHPLADVAYAGMFYEEETAGADLEALGIPGRDAFFDRYAELSGRGDGVDWTFYLAFNFFRKAAIGQGVLKRSMAQGASPATLGRSLVAIRECAVRGRRLIRHRQPPC